MTCIGRARHTGHWHAARGAHRFSSPVLRPRCLADASFVPSHGSLFLARKYGMFGFMHQAEPKTPVVNLFLVEPGGSPFKTVNGNEVIGVQSVPIVIGNMDSTTRVSPRQMKDETIGETKYTTTYRIENQLQAPHFMATTAGFFKPGCTGNMNPGATSNNAGKTKASCALSATISTEERLEYLEKWYSASKYLDNFATVTLGFYMQQEKITVRWKTVSEIWAEIGALWAGATMVIGWFFCQKWLPRQAWP